MSKKPTINQKDTDIFLAAIRGTKPLISKKIRVRSKPPEKSNKTFILQEEVLDLKEDQTVPLVSAEEYITYKHSSVPHKTLRKLQKGQYTITAILDLHGMSAEKAKDAVSHFLQRCLHKKIRVALIIHGKGLHTAAFPILKNKLNQWLRQLDIVLAFCTATKAHGGTGATYVLLKKESKI